MAVTKDEAERAFVQGFLGALPESWAKGDGSIPGEPVSNNAIFARAIFAGVWAFGLASQSKRETIYSVDPQPEPGPTPDVTC